MMMTVGMSLEWGHFFEVTRNKRLIGVTLAGQAVVLPVLGFLLMRVMALPPHVGAGILLLAACPVGDIANVYTQLARANTALSVTVNTLSCLLSAVTMAVVFAVYDRLLGGHFVFAVPSPALIIRLVVMVVLPVLAGMLMRRYKAQFVARYARTLQNIIIGGVVFMLVYVMVTQSDRLVADWRQTAVASMVFMAAAMMSGLAFGRILRLSAGNGLTVGIMFAVRNVGLATAIAVTLLNRVEYAVFAAIYFISEVPLLLGIVAVYRRRHVRNAIPLALQHPSPGYFRDAETAGPMTGGSDSMTHCDGMTG
jgi:bile acid:Na+ symporter, BASS family